jgi:hypothetical protein
MSKYRVLRFLENHDAAHGCIVGECETLPQARKIIRAYLGLFKLNPARKHPWVMNCGKWVIVVAAYGV